MTQELIVGILLTQPMIALVLGAPLANLAWRIEDVPVGTFLPYRDEPVGYPDGKV